MSLVVFFVAKMPKCFQSEPFEKQAKFQPCRERTLTMDDNAKGGLTQSWELLTVIPCALKDFKHK